MTRKVEQGPAPPTAAHLGHDANSLTPYGFLTIPILGLLLHRFIAGPDHDRNMQEEVSRYPVATGNHEKELATMGRYGNEMGSSGGWAKRCLASCVNPYFAT